MEANRAVFNGAGEARATESGNMPSTEELSFGILPPEARRAQVRRARIATMSDAVLASIAGLVPDIAAAWPLGQLRVGPDTDDDQQYLSPPRQLEPFLDTKDHRGDAGLPWSPPPRKL